MKYKYNNEWKDLTVKAGDTLPIGTIVDYDGTVIPTGYEEVEETEDYSTSETNTGKKWIDGKPIYRKVIQYTKTTNTEEDLTLSDYGITDVDNIWLNQNSFIKTNNNEYKTVNNYESSSYITYCTFPSSTSFRLGSNSQYARGTWNLIMEYTKTTD